MGYKTIIQATNEQTVKINKNLYTQSTIWWLPDGSGEGGGKSKG